MYGKILEKCGGASAFIGTGKNFKAQDHKMPNHFKKINSGVLILYQDRQGSQRGI